MTEILTNISKYIRDSTYFQAKFWVSSGRSDLKDVAWFLGVSGVLTILGVLLFLVQKIYFRESPPKRKLLVLFAWGLVLTGALGVIFALFRLEGIGFFSAYAFWALVILSSIVLIVFFGFRYLKVLPKEQARYESYLLKKKYLPKRKKRG